tara:strand:+ start:44 stop:376 length:333 start_codon:yes stop_codon:yes gene_type:complete
MEYKLLRKILWEISSEMDSFINSKTLADKRKHAHACLGLLPLLNWYSNEGGALIDLIDDEWITAGDLPDVNNDGIVLINDFMSADRDRKLRADAKRYARNSYKNYIAEQS